MTAKWIWIVSLFVAVSVQAQTTQTTQPDPVSQAFAQIRSVVQSAQSDAAQAKSQLSLAQATIAGQLAQINQLNASLSTLALPPGTDLGPLIPKATASNPIILSHNPKDSYVVTGTPVAYQNGGVIIGFGNTVKVTPAPGASSGIIIHADGWKFYGLNFTAGTNNTNLFRLYGTDPKTRTAPWQGTLIDSCSFDGSVAVGVNVDAWADNVTVQGCIFGITQAQGIYCTADNLNVHGCTFAGSVGEHPIRIDINGSTSHRPVNACITNCVITNDNIYGKEAIAVRECIGCTISDCVIPKGWLHWGQGHSDADIHVTDVTARNIAFGAIRPGPNGTPGGSLIQIEHDVNAAVYGVTAPGSVTDPLLSASDRSAVYIHNLSITGTPPAGKVFKVTSGSGKVTPI